MISNFIKPYMIIKMKTSGSLEPYDALSETPNGLSYFNGTSCPIVYSQKYDLERLANERLKTLLKDEPINEIKKRIYEQMVHFEKTFAIICDGKPATPEMVEEWISVHKESEGKPGWLFFYWYTNVYILLKLKVINNDNMNGMQFYYDVRAHLVKD